jgi:hypothetical protein
MLAGQRAKPLELAVVEFQQWFPSPVAQDELGRPLRPSVVRACHDIYNLGPRDDSPADETDTPVADHGLRQRRCYGQRNPRRSQAQVPPLVPSQVLRNSEDQPEHREDSGKPTGKPGASVAADHLLRCRTVRFRRLLGCPSVWDHETSMTLGEALPIRTIFALTLSMWLRARPSHRPSTRHRKTFCVSVRDVRTSS